MDKSTWTERNRITLALGPALLVLVAVLPTPTGMTDAAWLTAGIALLMATWWIGESIPIPATALIPLVLFPLAGAGTIRETAAPYADPIIFLFLGGFLIALAMERCGLHRRIALAVIRRAGTGPRALVGGFMIAAALLSMWVSNTATALMMLPVALSVSAVAASEADRPRFALALLLGLAYGCNIGGMGTLVGTPPNALMVGFLEQQYGVNISFASWLGIGLPIVMIGLPLTYLLLTRVLIKFEGIETTEGLHERLPQLGTMSRAERRVAVVFVLTALAWITRPFLPEFLGLLGQPGMRAAEALSGLSDAGIAMTAGLALFLVPSDFQKGEFLMDWQTARGLPWGTLILFGGGLSLAGAFVRTELSGWLGSSLAGLGAFPMILVLLVLVAMVVFLTELTSNAATTATMLPVVAAMAIGIGQNPLLLAVPAVLAASCAFMLPVATPPNAIVFGSGKVPIPEMARVGLWLNFLFIGLITAVAYLLVEAVLGAV